MRKIITRDLGRIGFWQAYRMQESLVKAKVSGDPSDYFLLVEHPHVFTTGRGGDLANLPQSAGDSSPIPVFRVNRGGDATYHGPGQIVGYPVTDLRGRNLDVNAYLRKLEEILLRTLKDFDLPVFSQCGSTGVWTGGRKIACIGIGVRKGITMHGFALNVKTELSYFDDIIPCGLRDVRMTSMRKELNSDISMVEVKRRLVFHLRNILTGSKCGLRAVPCTSKLAAFLKNTV